VLFCFYKKFFIYSYSKYKTLLYCLKNVLFTICGFLFNLCCASTWMCWYYLEVFKLLYNTHFIFYLKWIFLITEYTGFKLNKMSFDYIYCHFLTRSLLRKIEILFLLNNLSLLWPYNVKHGVLVSYIKRQLEIATHRSLT